MLSKRSQIGLISLTTLAATAAIWLFADDQSYYGPAQAALLRIGLVMGAVWIGFPQISKLPVWLATIGIVSVLAILLFKKAAIVLIPLLILIWLLRPRPSKKRTSTSRESSSSNR
ncbi:hypothetical protein [Bremerella alba]|uniref:Uncharacterized protein n=1 Tax=Bremerella alba TaxID=980252 RepID=A0A7V9A7C5_9BACT|nr:hypothetical protein [Bremerella alba]MBA2114846.1 hypothetical protein [Bremerella alba]